MKLIEMIGEVWSKFLYVSQEPDLLDTFPENPIKLDKLDNET